MSSGTKISLYNVEAGNQRACVTCLLMYIKSLVTVDLTQVSRLQIQGFFCECIWWEGETSYYLLIVLKAEENGELGSQLCDPHLGKRQILLPLPEESRKKQMSSPFPS